MKTVRLLKKQQGFALLEVMLAVIVILAAGLGVTKLYQSVTENSNTTKTEDIAKQVAGIASQMLSASNDPNDTIDTDDVIASGLLAPTSVVNGVIITPYGDVTAKSDSGTSGDHRQFIVSINGLPEGPATTLCRDLSSSYAVFKSKDGAGGTYVAKSSDCTDAGYTGTSNIVTFGYPKENYVDEDPS